MKQQSILICFFYSWKTSLWMNSTLIIKINKSVNKESLSLREESATK